MTITTAIRKSAPTAAAATVAIPAEWQMDSARMMARHVSGLVVTWQAPARGRHGQPALDISGIQKVTTGPWATQIEVLLKQAIVLLERAAV